MAGTKEGQLKAAATIKARYGSDFYQKTGALGGTVSKKGGFYTNRELAGELGRQIGVRTKKGYNLVYEDKTYRYYENIKTGEQLRYLINNTFKAQQGKFRTYMINGIEMSVSAIGREYGISYTTAHCRLRAGWMPWNVDDAPNY